METQVKDRIKVKLFVGYQLSSEMRMLLNQSSAWKRDCIVPASEQKKLSEVHFQNKVYIGRFVLQEELTMPQFKLIDNEMRTALQSYCPTLNLDSLLTYTFPQIFIS